MKVLNIKLQDWVHLINKLFEHVGVFEVKLRLWVGQLNAIMLIFQRCLQVNLMRPLPMFKVGHLREQVKTRFADLRPKQGFSVICNSVRTNRGQCCRSPADGTDRYAMQHWIENQVYLSRDSYVLLTICSSWLVPRTNASRSNDNCAIRRPYTIVHQSDFC